VVANLVTPRRDPHGQDKSRIDTSPFANTISQAVRWLSEDIKTYRSAGYIYDKPSERRSAEYHSSGKKSLKDILTKYLREEHELPEAEEATVSTEYDDEE
jgi:hypothetical protein